MKSCHTNLFWSLIETCYFRSMRIVHRYWNRTVTPNERIFKFKDTNVSSSALEILKAYAFLPCVHSWWCLSNHVRSPVTVGVVERRWSSNVLKDGQTFLWRIFSWLMRLRSDLCLLISHPPRSTLKNCHSLSESNNFEGCHAGIAGAAMHTILSKHW